MTTLTRRCAAWLACCAILFAALAPSVSHAMAAGRGLTWMEICSTSGSKFINADGVQIDAGNLDDDTGSHFEHCPFCSTHAELPALLPGTGFSIPAADQVARLPRLYYQSPRPLAIWTRAQSRAPPRQS
jgi:hypothetical protein